jgi:hypothetical protein
MKLICIDDVTDILKFGNGIRELTYGKEYEILFKYESKRGSDRIQIQIINDRGHRNEYLLSRFVTRDEFRELKLKEIGIF